MATKYRLDSFIKASTDCVTTPEVPLRYSDMRVRLFGGRGGRSDEIKTLSALWSGSRLSDIWTSIGYSKSIGKRADESKRTAQEIAGIYC